MASIPDGVKRPYGEPESDVATSPAPNVPLPEGRPNSPHRPPGASDPLNIPRSAAAATQALLRYLNDDECSEVLLNGPTECSRKVRGARYHCPEVVFPDATTYHTVLNEALLRYVDTKDRIDGNTVLIEGQLELPNSSGLPEMLARVHIIAPPGVKYAKVTVAKKPRTNLTVDDMVVNGSMTREMGEFLKAVSRGRATFVVSGPTGAGKSTLLQAMTQHFDLNDRVVVIEETPELTIPLGDVVYLRSTLERPGMDPKDNYTVEFWAKQANRMRMDRVIVGETRGAELAEWLVAANSGAEGSATTVHAESPRRALDKMMALAARSQWLTSEAQLRRDIAGTIDIVIQTSLVDGRHVVTGIEEVTNTIVQSTDQISTNPLFTYDRARGMHVVQGRPSDEFIATLNSRGVPVDRTWFQHSMMR